MGRVTCDSDLETTDGPSAMLNTETNDASSVACHTGMSHVTYEWGMSHIRAEWNTEIHTVDSESCHM